MICNSQQRNFRNIYTKREKVWTEQQSTLYDASYIRNTCNSELGKEMASLITRAPRLASRTRIPPPFVGLCIRYKTPFVIQAYSSTSDPSEPPIDDSMLPQPIDRSYETPDVTRARLLYQSRKRGILETDLLLSTFAHKHLPSMSEAEMHEYDKVILVYRKISADNTVTGRTGLGDILLGYSKETCPRRMEE